MPPASLNAEIGLDDGICQAVLPCGLAAHLLLDENAPQAAFFHERYEQLKRAFAAIPREFSEIEDVYGGICFGQPGAWG